MTYIWLSIHDVISPISKNLNKGIDFRCCQATYSSKPCSCLSKTSDLRFKTSIDIQLDASSFKKHILPPWNSHGTTPPCTCFIPNLSLFLQPAPMRPTLVSSSSLHRRWCCWWPKGNMNLHVVGKNLPSWTGHRWLSVIKSIQKCFGCSCFLENNKALGVTHLRNVLAGHYPPFHPVVHEIECK